MMILKHWKFRKRRQTIVGRIYNDETGRFNNGDMIETSQIQEIDFNTSTIKTLNHTYVLDFTTMKKDKETMKFNEGQYFFIKSYNFYEEMQKNKKWYKKIFKGGKK